MLPDQCRRFPYNRISGYNADYQWERLKSMFVSQRFLSFILPPAVLVFVLFAGLAPLSAAMGRALPGPGVLAFSTPTDPRTEWHIILLDVRTRIAHTIGRYGWRIALPLEWSPDGSRIAFATVNTPSDIFIHDIYAGTTTNVTRSFADDRYPTWSPDGSSLLFFSNLNGQFEIYRVQPDGTNLTRLTHDEGILPAFSPDGARILFTATARRNLYLMNADGSDTRPVTQGPRNDRNGVWSPDGTKIGFVGLPRGTGHYIFILDAACMDQSDCEPHLLVPGFRFQGMPQWSPDGRWLAFVGQRPTDRADSIYVIDLLHTAEPRRLVSDVFYAYAERWSMWSPDSRYIAYAGRSQPGLFIVEVATGAVQQLSHLRSVYPVWQP